MVVRQRHPSVGETLFAKVKYLKTIVKWPYEDFFSLEKGDKTPFKNKKDFVVDLSNGKEKSCFPARIVS